MSEQSGKTMQRITSISLILITAFLNSFCQSKADNVPRPNVIIIMADDLGYGDLSVYGNPEFRTPAIDALAAEGIRFLDYHSNGPVCSPTRAALMTGRYQQRAGLEGVIYVGFDSNRHHGMDPQEYTLAEALRTNGYRTGIFGKWHLGYDTRFNPIHHGFETFRGYVSGNIDYHNHYDRAGILDWWENDTVNDEPGYSTHLITRHAIDFIQHHKDEPFFVYVSHEAPHDPFQGPADPPIRAPGKFMPEPRDSAYVARAYREMVQEMDDGIGEIVSVIRSLGLDKKTFLFFCSDNGATPRGSNAPLRGRKSQLWEGGHRVPAVAWWPGQIEGGQTTSQTAATIDIMPTVLDIAGVPIPDNHVLDGTNLRPVLLDKQAPSQRSLYWAYRGQKAYRDGPWKMLVLPGPADQQASQTYLFDLSQDLAEQNNLVDLYPDRVRAMSMSLHSWYDDVMLDATPQPKEPLVDPFGRY